MCILWLRFGIQRYGKIERYEGEFYDYERNGYGIYYYPDGNIYEGEWKDGKKHGIGKYTFKDGDSYTGEFTDDRFEGIGVHTMVIVKSLLKNTFLEAILKRELKKDLEL